MVQLERSPLAAMKSFDSVRSKINNYINKIIKFLKDNSYKDSKEMSGVGNADDTVTGLKKKLNIMLYVYYIPNYVLCCAWSLNCARLFSIPWTVTRQAPLSMGILQAGILEWVAMPSPRRSSQPRD